MRVQEQTFSKGWVLEMGDASTITIAVIGGGKCSQEAYDTARCLGRLLALAGCTLVCGGLGGIMEAASEGASSVSGRTIGILPGLDKRASNEFINTSIVTGLGQMRNFLVVANADIVIAVDGGWGTLSEVALAKKIGKEVIVLGKWSSIPGILPAKTPEQAVRLVRERFLN